MTKDLTTSTEEGTLTKEQIEYLAQYLFLFKKAYLLHFSKELKTVDEIIDVIKKGDFTFDDVFMIYVDKCFQNNDSQEAEYFWEDNMSLFDAENYFPKSNKRIEAGAWIKIRTENGFEVHFAKRSNRKRRFNEEFEKVSSQLERSLRNVTNKLSDVNGTMKVDEILSPKVKSKHALLERQMNELKVRMLLELKPYEVRIQRTKSKVEYYLPSQYEIVENIEEFSDAYIASVPGVNIKTLYTSQNADAIFYLTSRGISRKVAEMLAALKQTYFKVDMVTAMNSFNEMLRQRVKFVKS